ncbi:M20/M25/M40 family metallo-hydrolase [Alteribacillus bidgolensis]|uniref:Arginine utilization protein RocB n=1 Tax=Alteribacillus bidgolensis TaxID=930129 RepID=A0A1G8L7Y1_9BACI|nr:M20/M25/M40 family metallo-hydrolase [Alteribacillus bidgolensis]SDI51756.1 Arginine utilization protein RocB [Alteribacillus bidgolensis]
MKQTKAEKRTALSPKELFQTISLSKDMSDSLERITTALMNIPSVTDTIGEKELADYLFAFLREFPYFQRYPAQLWEQPLPNDQLQRKNVFALVKGENISSNKTVVYHSHMDTVGIKDFGFLKKFAFNSKKLSQHFASSSQNAVLKEEAESGDWLFGRGSVDMKSGIAVHLMNLFSFSEQIEELNGNVLLLLNPAEENDHSGIMEAVREFQRLEEEESLELSLAINNDYTTALYDNDPNRYIYTGSAGKILPCFSIFGREAHVGETLSGIDPTFISSELNRRINYNMNLTERMEGELVLPPTCLYQRDNKESYNVQTALSSRLYFNYFIYKESPKNILDTLLKETKAACEEVKNHMKDQHLNFLAYTHMPASEHLDWEIEVMTLKEYCVHLEKKGIHSSLLWDEVLNNSDTTDKRELCFELVERLHEEDPDKKPMVILFLAPPFIPYNHLDEGIKIEKEILDLLQETMEEAEREFGETFVMKRFFPFLSDSSFLSLKETGEEANYLRENFPEMEKIYPIPMQTIQKLNLPAVNLGVYGKDAHKRSERLFKPYSFNTLPDLIQKVTLKMLNREQ